MIDLTKPIDLHHDLYVDKWVEWQDLSLENLIIRFSAATGISLEILNQLDIAEIGIIAEFLKTIPRSEWRKVKIEVGL